MLRAQPPRSAPSSLEARVLGEIARRQALPWWHKSYNYWPAPVRLAFLVAGVALLAAALFGSMQVAGLLSPAAIATAWRPVQDASATLHTAGEALLSLLRQMLPSISHQWLYAALAVIGAAYALMVGLGATAYRLLWQDQR